MILFIFGFLIAFMSFIWYTKTRGSVAGLFVAIGFAMMVIELLVAISKVMK